MGPQKQDYIKILIAPDKFKGSLTSAQAAEAIRRGIERGNLQNGNPYSLLFRMVEIADGGDGSLEVLQGRISDSRIFPVVVHDPIGREVDSQILLYEKRGVRCAFIEMAKVSGLEMLSKDERNPLHTSTYGMGEAISAAVGEGVHSITLSIGGSATNDGGAGMLQSLGYRFLNKEGLEMDIPLCGGNLSDIATIIPPGSILENMETSLLSGVEFKVICDVTNPLLGSQGATAVYGPQKGADAGALKELEAGLANFAAVAEMCLGTDPSRKDYPGAGAAGGVGYAGLAFLGAELIPGWRFFADVTSLEESVQWADMVITGEGSLDSQSLSGKVVSGVLNLAARHHKPAKIFCGVSKLNKPEMEGLEKMLPEGVKCHSIASLGHPIEVCMRDAAQLLQQLAQDNL